MPLGREHRAGRTVTNSSARRSEVAVGQHLLFGLAERKLNLDLIKPLPAAPRLQETQEAEGQK